MSMSLHWEPKERVQESLPDELKYVLRKRFGDIIDRDFDSGDYWYLKGLSDAGVDGADELLEAISKYGSVHVIEK